MATTTQSKLILYLIILLGLVGGYLYNAQADPYAVVPLQPQDISGAELSGLGSLRVNYTVLQDERYRDLQIFGEYPVPTTAPGKSNPFQ